MKVGEIGIKDFGIYVGRMQKSVLDKMFFIDKVFEPFSTIVDFGCANGELIRALSSLFPEYRYVGYDISEDMINAAKNSGICGDFYTDWSKIDADFSSSLFNISSTLHEIYSYCTQDEIEDFWKKAFKSNFKYVCIRDMMFSDKDKTFIDENALKAVKNNAKYAEKLKDYEKIWGKISNQHELAHYLLKYKYTENWQREVSENYVPVSIEKLLSLIPNDYEITYLNHFTLPYIAWQIRNDFGIDLATNTHIKIILKRKS